MLDPVEDDCLPEQYLSLDNLLSLAIKLLGTLKPNLLMWMCQDHPLLAGVYLGPGGPGIEDD